MNFRITYGAVYMTADNLFEARDHAMTEARELTRVCGFSVVATVHMSGLQVFDDFGRDVTPVSLVGKAIGRIENGNAVVDWESILTVKQPKMVLGGEARGGPVMLEARGCIS